MEGSEIRQTNRDLTAHLMDSDFAREQYHNQRQAIQAQKERNGLKNKTKT